VDVKDCHNQEVAKQFGLTQPFKEVAFDFSLVPQSPTT
jgi:hypothetical protein